MNSEVAINKLNQYGRELYDMLLSTHALTHLTGIQVERILSFQDRIVDVTDNTRKDISKDNYPRRFKLKGKGTHGGYLDTNRFLKVLLNNPDSKKVTPNPELFIAQA